MPDFFKESKPAVKGIRVKRTRLFFLFIGKSFQISSITGCIEFFFVLQNPINFDRHALADQFFGVQSAITLFFLAIESLLGFWRIILGILGINNLKNLFS